MLDPSAAARITGVRAVARRRSHGGQLGLDGLDGLLVAVGELPRPSRSSSQPTVDSPGTGNLGRELKRDGAAPVREAVAERLHLLEGDLGTVEGAEQVRAQ